MNSVRAAVTSTGSVQSRNIEIPHIESDSSDEEDEFVDCSSEMLDTNLAHYDEIKPSGDDDTKKKLSKNDDDEEEDDDDESVEARKERQRKELDDFKEEMSQKRKLRQQCMQKLREELNDLREKLTNEMMINEQLRTERGSDKSIDDLIAENKRLKIDLSECQNYLQTSNAENINATLETQALRDHVRSLKEVIKAIKEMLSIREVQVDQLKSKLTEIELSFADKEAKIMSSALQQEYQRQLENIRSMRELYEQRSNLLIQDRNTIQRQLDDKEHDLATEIEK